MSDLSRIFVNSPRPLELIRVGFDTNNTSAPDGVVHPAPGITVTVARADVGDFTITLPAGSRPKELLFGAVTILGDEARLHGKVTGYTAATGVVTLTIYEEQDDGADTDPDNGISVAADTTDKSVRVLLVFEDD